MEPLTGVVLAAALLLVSTGAVKLARPSALASAVSSLGISRFAVGLARGVGAAELVVGMWLGATGSALACLAAGTLFTGFTGFLWVALRAPDRVRTCGCTAALDSPPTWQHAVLTAGLGGACWLAYATGGVTPLTRMAAVTDWLTVTTVLGYAAVVTALAWAVLALLPQVRPSQRKR